MLQLQIHYSENRFMQCSHGGAATGVAVIEKYQSYNKVLNRGIVGNKEIQLKLLL